VPEGPSIVILKEAVEIFAGRSVTAITGNSKIDQQRLLNKQVIEFRSWGKHFLICFDGFTVRVHFLLFGSYLVNERKDKPVRLSLQFENGELNLYACAIRIIEGDLDMIYEWDADVMSDAWDGKKAMKKLQLLPAVMVCDVLLNQDIFAGVGNIIKNEVLYRIKVHPLSLCGKLPRARLKLLVEEARQYSFDFYEWKKRYELRKHWLAHAKKVCNRCNIPLIKEVTGRSARRSFFCNKCQRLYG
jgi:endonuclease-8